MSYIVKTNIETKNFTTRTWCEKYINKILKNATLIGLDKVEIKESYNFFNEKTNCYMFGYRKKLLNDFLRGL